MSKVKKSVRANTGYREKENVDNILFIGNGFDRKNHMKTSYENYLDSLKIDNDMLEKIMLIYEFEGTIEYLEDYKISKRSGSFSYTFVSNNDIYKAFTIEADMGYKFNYTLLDQMKKRKYDEETTFVSLERDEKIFYTYMAICQNSVITGSYFYSDTKDYKPLSNYIRVSDELKEYVYKNKFEDFLELYYNINTWIEKAKISFFSVYLEISRKKIDNTSKVYQNIKELRLKDDKWIEIENILYENQFQFFRSTLSATKNVKMLNDNNKLKYENFIKLFNTEISVDKDFRKFKKSFARYIKVQQNKLKNKANINKFVNNIYNEFHFNKIYNFNYSNYINDIVKEIDNTILVDNIHGSIDDGEKIVFGTNHYLFKQDNEEHNKIIKENEYTDVLIANTEANYKLTKIYQVLELSDTRNSKILGKVNSLTILGHSIGKQDFEYMHTIIMTNPKEIVLNILYSSEVGNRAELTDAVYEMLGKYEELHGDVTIHKMILENRIKFIDMETFK